MMGIMVSFAPDIMCGGKDGSDDGSDVELRIAIAESTS